MTDGTHVRHHTKSKLSLFTLAKVKSSPKSLNSLWTTAGIKKDGTTFVGMDDWHNHEDSHGQLDLEWTGYTIFHSSVDEGEMLP